MTPVKLDICIVPVVSTQAIQFLISYFTSTTMAAIHTSKTGMMLLPFYVAS
jgi:hypothetical protein